MSERRFYHVRQKDNYIDEVVMAVPETIDNDRKELNECERM